LGGEYHARLWTGFLWIWCIGGMRQGCVPVFQGQLACMRILLLLRVQIFSGTCPLSSGWSCIGWGSRIGHNRVWVHGSARLVWEMGVWVSSRGRRGRSRLSVGTFPILSSVALVFFLWLYRVRTIVSRRTTLCWLVGMLLWLVSQLCHCLWCWRGLGTMRSEFWGPVCCRAYCRFWCMWWLFWLCCLWKVNSYYGRIWHGKDHAAKRAFYEDRWTQHICFALQRWGVEKCLDNHGLNDYAEASVGIEHRKHTTIGAHCQGKSISFVVYITGNNYHNYSLNFSSWMNPPQASTRKLLGLSRCSCTLFGG